MTRRILKTAEVAALRLGVPAGHRHLRAVLELRGGEELVLQEATVAALVRAFVALKTHPARHEVRLTGRSLSVPERKSGFAEWQLLEDE